MMEKMPWTREQLVELIPRVKREIAEIENGESHDVRPLPVLTVDECLEHFNGLMQSAQTRVLTEQEAFIHGQMLAQFQQAVIRKYLKKPGRFYLVPEETVREMIAQGQT